MRARIVCTDDAAFLEKPVKAKLTLADNLQKQVYKDCFERYWKRAEILTTTDVDEFLYPCPTMWSDSNVFRKAVNSYRENDERRHADHPEYALFPIVVQLECYKFGLHGRETDSPAPTIASSHYRAKYDDDDDGWPVPNIIVNACKQFADPPGRFCENYGARKHLYITKGIHARAELLEAEEPHKTRRRLLDYEPPTFPFAFPGFSLLRPPEDKNFHPWLPVLPSVHWFRGAGALIKVDPAKARSQPVCCNHYAQRSYANERTKGLKNRNFNEKRWERLGSAKHPAWLFWDLVYDDAAHRFYSQLLDQGYVEL